MFWETKPCLVKINGITLANTTRSNVSAIVTRSQTRLTGIPDRHEGYYISKEQQTVRIPSGEHFEFLADELINVEYSHKVDISLRVTHPWFHQLTVGTVQRTGYFYHIRERKPSPDPTLDGPHLSLLAVASREAAVCIPSPQVAL